MRLVRRALWMTPWGVLPVVAAGYGTSRYASWSNDCGYEHDAGARFATTVLLLLGIPVLLMLSTGLGLATRGAAWWVRLGLLSLALSAAATAMPFALGGGGACP